MESFYILIDILTSGRLASTSAIPSMFQNVLNVSPIVGTGFGSVITTDMGFLEIFCMAGSIGLLLYFFIFFIIFNRTKAPRTVHKKEKIFLYFMWIILFFSSLGGSSITANRVSIFIWIITTLLLLSINQNHFKLRLLKKIRRSRNKDDE